MHAKNQNLYPIHNSNPHIRITRSKNIHMYHYFTTVAYACLLNIFIIFLINQN